MNGRSERAVARTMEGEETLARSALPPRYRWQLRTERSPGTVTELLALLLEHRGIGGLAAERFLNPPYEESLPDALLLPQCGPAVSRIQRALRSSERIAVFGDYDVDGVAGSALLADALRLLGAPVTVDLPHREDGYGLNVDAVRRLVPSHTLLITVDNGTAARDAVAEAFYQGADVIILDHHTVQGALPPGALVVNPHLASSRYPHKTLSAAGVVWKVVSALFAAEHRGGEEKYLLDLVLLGTLADSMDLQGENRALVRWGLEVLRRTRRVGLRVLAEQAGLAISTVTAEEVTFKLIPRLNAAGRVRHASLALELLLAEDQGTARRLAMELDAANLERKLLTEEILERVTRTLPADLPPILLVAGPWPLGILGILASRLAEERCRPTVAVAVRDDECIASMRGDGANIVGLVREAEYLLTRFGGHRGAAGFSFPRSALPDVQAFFSTHLPLTESRASSDLVLDCPLPLSLVTTDLARALEVLEPHGNGNERPVFLVPGVSVEETRVVGKGGEHLRCVIRAFGSVSGWTAVAFRWGSRPRPKRGDTLDLAAEVRRNTFRGSVQVDLHLRDARGVLEESGA